MDIVTTGLTDRARLRACIEDRVTVVALCAAWCSTCTEFRRGLAALAPTACEVALVWLDVEDDAALCGDIDVESFPTLVAFRGDVVLHYGVTVPSAAVTARLVQELAARERGMIDVPEEVRALGRTLRRVAEALT